MLQDLWLKIQEIILVVLRSFQELPRGKRLVLIVCLVAMIPAFFIAKYGSFAFWNWQYKDLRVVAAPAFQSSQDVEVGTAKVIRSGDNLYSVYTKIKNRNLDLALQDARYEFTFFNNSGDVVKTQQGGLFLLPDQEKYIVVSNVVSTEVITSAKVVLSQVNWQKKAAIPKIVIRTPAPTTYEEVNPLQFVAEGVIVNESPYRLGTVRITFVLYDASGEIIGISERSEFSVRSSERRAYVQRWPGLYESEVARVEVFAETNSLNGNNLILEDLPSVGGSSLDRPDTDFY
ncbi:MAG: hypothetical protein IT410_02880 [Candidatus Doudnabacteria bacterium]|nr:hypothetical protein [Candidatus Doudnabacteria bacterium]